MNVALICSERNTVLLMDSSYIALESFFPGSPILDCFSQPPPSTFQGVFPCAAWQASWWYVGFQAPALQVHTGLLLSLVSAHLVDSWRAFSDVQLVLFSPAHLQIFITLQGASFEIGLQVQEILRWQKRKLDDEQIDGNCCHKIPHFFTKLC